MKVILLKLLVSIALLVFLIQRTPVDAIARELARMDVSTLLIGAVLSISAWLLSALRLWCLIPGFSLTQVTHMTIVSLLYGTILPGQMAGDVVKAYRLSRVQSFPGQAAAATIVDRGLSLFTLFGIAALAALILDEPSMTLRIALCAAFLSAPVLTWLLTLAEIRDWLSAQARTSGAVARPIFGLLDRLARAIHDALRHGRRVTLNIALALLFHAICIGIQVFLGRSLSINISIEAWSLVYAGVSVLVLLPITIAGLGLREGGYVGLLGLFGVQREAAFALSFTMLGYLLLGAILGGILEIGSSVRKAGSRTDIP